VTNLVEVKKSPAKPDSPPPKSPRSPASKSKSPLRELAHRVGTDAVARALDQAA